MKSETIVDELVSKPYKYGFVTEIETEKMDSIAG